MMKSYKHLTVCLIIILLCSCKKEKYETIDWYKFQTGLINFETEVVNVEISKYLNHTKPMPTETDEIGHRKNLENLRVQIDNSGIITVEFFCYACIKTYPPYSEIKIVTDSSGIAINRVLDILTPENRKLEFTGMHE